MPFCERSTSVWKVAHTPFATAPLGGGTVDADVCVIGAGIAGLSVAYELSRAGRAVLVIEARVAGAGETAQTTGHLSSALDDGFVRLEQLHGRAGARLAYESHAAAITRIEQVAREEGIACDFQRLDGYLLLAEGDTPRSLDDELVAARRAGFENAEPVASAPLAGWQSGACLRFPGQGQFHPLRYVNGLCEAIMRRGGRIATGTSALAIHGGSSPRVETSTGATITARAVVVATNTPINDRFAIHVKQAAYRSFAIGLSVPPDAIAERALYWDTSDPYHYVRFAEGADGVTRLVVGGEDHKTGECDDAPKRFDRLERWAKERFPMAGARELQWSGQVLEPFDSLAYIGSNPGGPDNVFIATGDSGHGLTHGAIAGMLIKDLVLGSKSPWQSLYDPARKRVSRTSIKDYLQIVGTVTRHYVEWLRPKARGSLAELTPGSGMVVQRGSQRLAVFKDESGTLIACSAVCPHLGCIVHWNSQERSWDCPCHGSRFEPSGEVLSGPSIRGLARAEPPPLGCQQMR